MNNTTSEFIQKSSNDCVWWDIFYVFASQFGSWI